MGATVDAYLARLPNGLASYPEVLVKGSVIRSSVENLPDGARTIATGMPEIDALVTDPPAVSAWVPQVHHCLLLASIYDRFFSVAGGQTAFDAWVYDRNRQLFRSPAYKILFAVVSPERLIVGLANRWSAFRRGVAVEVVERRGSAGTLAMRYPPYVMDALTLRGIAVALRAALDAGGAEQAFVTVTEPGPTEARFSVRWRS